MTQPAGNGNIVGQDGYWSWWSAEPASSGGSGGEDDSVGAAVLGVGAGVVVLGVVGGFLVMRRRSAVADDRE
jgi:peptide/nickel transport system substrate-binding protein